MLSDRQKGVLLFLTSASGFAFLPTITRLIYSSAADSGVTFLPTDIAFWRFVIATLVMGVLAFVKVRRALVQPSIPLRQLAVLGGLYTLSALAAFFGLQYIGASLYIVLFYTYPAMLALISVAMGVRLSGWQWLAVGMALLGVVFTIPDFSFITTGGNLLGMLIALGNALCVALYFILSGRWVTRAIDSIYHTAWMMLATLFFITLTVPFYGLHLPTSLPLIGFMLTMSILCTVVPILAMNTGLNYVSPTQASIVSSVEPVIAIFIAVLFLGEVVAATQWLGVGLILSAVLVLELSPKRKTA